jgi:ribosomal protein L37AE/L43A
MNPLSLKTIIRVKCPSCNERYMFKRKFGSIEYWVCHNCTLIYPEDFFNTFETKLEESNIIRE